MTIFLLILAVGVAEEVTVLSTVLVDPSGSVAGSGVLSVICVQVALVTVAISLLITGISVPESLFL